MTDPTTRDGSTRAHADESPFSHIRHPARRAFLEALAANGSRTDAARATGIARTTPYSEAWRADPDFMEALPVAEQIAADTLVHEALRRATTGTRVPQFHTRTGRPLEHPDQCDCGHDRLQWHPATPDGEHGPCSHPGCDCQAFRGSPVYEATRSDRLLELLLRARLPEAFGKRAELALTATAVRNIDMDLLPDAVVDAIARGRHPLAVLAAAIAGSGADARQTRKALASSAGPREARPGEILQGGESGDDPPAANTPDATRTPEYQDPGDL